MPSRVVTKRRVKGRRRLVSKNVKRKERTARTLRKHRKSVKKVMRGGDLHSVIAAKHAERAEDDDGRPSYDSQPKRTTGTAYVLYDKIPYVENNKVTTSSINVPICVIFIVPIPRTVDDIYLFFNSKMTAEEITSIVKLLLGIEATEQFELTPPIQLSSPISTAESNNSSPISLRNFIGNTFVKLTKCGAMNGRFTYCIVSGAFVDHTNLDQASTTKHEIKTGNKTYLELDGAKIRAYLKDPSDTGFKQKVLTSQTALPDLYKDYFIQSKEEKPTEETKNLAIEKFGVDIEGDGPGKKTRGVWTLNSGRFDKVYETFKQDNIQMILDQKMKIQNHSQWGLSPDVFEKLSKNQPLELMTRIDIDYEELIASKIIMSINNSLKKRNVEFSYEKNWWEKKEEAEWARLLENIDLNKRERVECDVPNRNNYCSHND